MSDTEKVSIGCNGCGCVSLILFVFLVWSLFFGLPTPWGKINIDIFPPKIWNMDVEKS